MHPSLDSSNCQCVRISDSEANISESVTCLRHEIVAWWLALAICQRASSDLTSMWLEYASEVISRTFRYQGCGFSRKVGNFATCPSGRHKLRASYRIHTSCLCMYLHNSNSGHLSTMRGWNGKCKRMSKAE